MRHAVEDLVEGRHAEAGVVRTAEHHPRDRTEFGRELRIEGRSEARVIVDTRRRAQLQHAEDRQRNLAIGGLHVARNLSQRIDIVEGDVEDVRRRQRASGRTVELVALVPVIDPDRDFRHATGQTEQAAGDRRVELADFIFTAVQPNALGRNCLEPSEGRGRLRERERVQNAAVEQTDDAGRSGTGGGRGAGIDTADDGTRNARCCRGGRAREHAAIVIARTEHRTRRAGRIGPTGAIIPTGEQRPVDADRGAEGLRVGLIFARAAGDAAEAERDRLTVIARDCRQRADDAVKNRIVRRCGQRIERIGDRQRGVVRGVLIVRKNLARLGIRSGDFGKDFMPAELRGGAAVIGQRLDRLLQRCRAARVPRAGQRRIGRVVQHRIIVQPTIDRVATSATGEAQRVDAAERRDGRARDEEAGIRCQRGRTARAAKQRAALRDADARSSRIDRKGGRQRRAARIDRQAAIWLVAVDEITVLAKQRAVPALADRAHDVEALLVELAVPHRP